MRPAAATRFVVLCLGLAGAAGHARGDDLPGTPKPSRGAPGDQPGRGDAFGTQGGKALESSTPAEVQAARVARVVERIDVRGQHRTRAEVIRDHLAFREGEVLTADAVLVSRVRLMQLGGFSRVEVETSPGGAPGRVVVEVIVTEKAAVSLTDFTLRHTPVSPLYGALGLADADVAGLGVGAAAATALDGHGRHGARLSLYDPERRIGGASWVLGLQALWNEGLESACTTPRCGGNFSAIPWLRYRRLGATVNAGWRPGVFTRLLFGYRLEALRATTDAGADPAARPIVREGRSRVSALEVGFDADSRADAFLPREGSRLEVRVTLATAALGSDYEYGRWLVQGERWFPSGTGNAFRLDGAVGLVQGEAPFYERFYAADWSYFSVGLAAPRALDLNFSPDSRYDALLAVGGVEYDLSLWDAAHGFFRRGVLALGMRAVYTARSPGEGRSVLSATPVSVDAALRLDTAVGVVGIGLGYVADQILKVVPLQVPGIQYR